MKGLFMRSQGRRAAAVAVRLCLWLTAPTALAQGTAAYDTLETHTGPVAGDSRQLGLGGAYVALAEGARGIGANPAAVAYRFPYDVSTLGWDLGLDASIAGVSPNTKPAEGTYVLEPRNLALGSLAASFQVGHAGVGFSAEARRQALRTTAVEAGLVPSSLTGNFGVLHFAVGFGFFDGQAIVGMGPRVAGVSLNIAEAGELISVSGLGYEVGALFGPQGEAFRAAVAFRTPVEAVTSATAASDDGVWSPDRVSLPWEASAGFVYQLGERPLNVSSQTIDDRVSRLTEEFERRERLRARRRKRLVRAHAISRAERERLIGIIDAARRRDLRALDEARAIARKEWQRRYASLPRRYVLFSSEVLVVGSSPNTLPVGALLSQDPDASDAVKAAAVTVSPRLGMESELLPRRLRLRTGVYLEPARVSSLDPRVHATWGADVRLLEWDVFGLLGDSTSWRLSAAADVAFGYRNTSLGLGFWH